MSYGENAVIRNESKAVARIRQAARTAVNATFETLEDRRLMAGDSSYIATLPFALEFDAPRGGLADRNGNGTGFTWVQANKNNNEYQPNNLNLSLGQGILYLTTTGTAAAGGPFDNDNTLTNSLQTQFNASTGAFTIRTRLVGPLNYIDLASEQGGIVFGPDQDNYVKLVAVAQPGGTFLQFLDEQKTGASFTHQISSSASLVNIGSFASINTLDLEMVGDAATGKVQAFYRINGGALTKLAQEVTLTGAAKANFFSDKGKAGLIAMHKNDAGATTVAFDRFEITAENPTTNRPSVTASRPAAGTINVSRDSFIAVDVKLPTAGHGVDAATLTNLTVKLYRTSDHKLIDATVNTTGGGDAIVLTPSVILDANTGYTFEINDGVKDTSGKAFVPFVMSFTTGTNTTPVDANIAFEKVQLGTATGQQYSGLTIGPDGKLYATTAKGLIHRFDIKSDGTLSSPTVIDVVRSNNGGDRFVTGLVFDPASTANNLVAYISHNHPTLDDAPEWSGKISRLSGANLGTYEDYVVGLPRSIRDHLTNQMAFGPDGKLYVSQGSISAMGAPDNAWGLRAETLLAGAILKIDTAAIAARIAGGQGALDVQTAGNSNPYNPFTANAPLKLYATGVRNAYDLVWHSNGNLYAPTNGSAAGGATPGFSGGTYNGTRIDSAQNGPFTSNPISAIGTVNQTENDYLHRIVDGGYYGHPNPTRGEFVQDGGNPTAGVDYEEFTQYPTGTAPDRNYRGAAYVFGKNYSPNGAVEYKSDAFGVRLKGKLLVVRYSGGDDIVSMDVQGDGSVISLQSGITGLSGLVDPLDLVADNSNGNIYVSEYGAQKITLLRPIAAGSHVEVSKPELYFSDVRGGAASPAQKLTIKNNGTAVLNLNSLVLSGGDASQFVIVTKPDTPTTIPVGGSVEVSIAFSASSSTSIGIKSTTLAIATSDPNRPTINVSLRGLAIVAEGGANEPSLQRIFDLYNMPIKTGDINPASANLYSNSEPLSSINDEVSMQRLEKAGTGPVTFELISSWGANSVPSVRFGTYSPGSPATKSELFVVGKTDAQTVNPTAIGNTSFDPGTNAFSLYTVWPAFANREIYSEDTLNTVEGNASQRHKVHFYALKNPDGSVVPNAYVVAFEEFINDSNNATDSQDIVAIIRNVKPSTTGAEIGLENMDGVPSQGRMIFSRIQVQPPAPVKQADGSYVQPPDNVVHDRGVMRIRNTGSTNLNVSDFQFTGAFALLAGQSSTYTIAPGAYVDVTIVFNAQSGGVQEGSVKVLSNDSDEPISEMKLAGMWQEYSEQFPGGNIAEKSLQEFFTLFGYSTKAVNPGQSLSNQGRPEAVGDEVLSAYWQAADPTSAIKVTQLAAFHTQGNTEEIRTFLKGNKSAQTALFTHDGLMGQSILPTLYGDTRLAQATIPTAVANTVFGFKIAGIYSDDALSNQRDPDTGEAHWVRMYPAKDASGAVIPNTWLIAMDYYGINYDYQDNIYLITNVRPATPSTPSNVAATTAPGGIKVSWTNSPEATATGYDIYRSESATGTFVKVNNAPVAASEFLDTTAPASATSYYKISAADNYGGESAPSAVVSAARGADATAPNVPTGVTGSSRLDGVLVNWVANTEGDLAGYKVYRSTSIDGTYTALNGGTVLTNNTLLDTGTNESATYYYKVSSVDQAGNESAMSAYATGTRVPPPDFVAPDAPTSISATGQLNGIKVTWAANTEPDLAGYRLYRSTTLNGEYTLLTSGQLVLGQTFVDTSVGIRTYYYKVVAIDNSGNTSAASASASATRISPDPIRINSGGQAFTDAAGISWEADRGFSGGNVSTSAYDVLGTTDDVLYYTRRSGNFNYNLAMPDGAYKVRLLLADATYAASNKRLFDVFAEGQQIYDNFDIAGNVGKNTATSKTFNVSVTGGELNLRFANTLDNAVLSAIEILPIGDTVAPSIPRRPASSGSQEGIRLDWNDNADSDLSGYNVYRSEDGESNFVKLNPAALATSEFTDATADPGKTWYYRITAVDIYGNESSGLSTSGSRPADTTPPAVPTGVTTTPSVLGIGLDWANNTDADLGGYNVYRRNESNGQFVKLNSALLTASTYNDTAAVEGIANAYRITAVDTRGNESSFLETNADRPAAGTGLKAEYFDNKDLTNPKLTRTDAKIDFNWAAGSPDASIGVDTFSVRWTGQIQAGTTGAYTFTISADDGVRMYVNDVLVIDKFTNAGVVKDHVSTPVQLTAGQNANIRIEYFENTGGAYIQMYWESATMAKTIVPTAALFPPAV
jgi:fibronectin type 3 domain-containing protein/glucose/arabinose dehydrogenase